MKKYLYLTKKEWVYPWVKGGVVPLFQASKYLSDERDGVMTPDENLVDTSSHDIKVLGNGINIEVGATVTFRDCSFDGVFHPGLIKIDRKIEDGLVLCLANKKCSELAKKLGKVACVEISDIAHLKRHLDKQIGIASIMKACEYTEDHQRNHFLKSSLDAWQEEYRIFWPGAKSTRVSIPSGMAKEVIIRSNKFS
jgi:hypothetical protein